VNIRCLHQLREAGGAFVPCDTLGDPQAIRLALDELSAFGYAIERHPYLGAAYRGPASRLSPDQIEYELGTERIGRRIAVWNRVSSTNDLAALAATSSSNEGLVVLAEEQSAGRGRRGRAWSSPPRSSILMSVLLFPSGTLAEPAWLTALGAVAVAEVVSEWTGREAAIKWPNDVRIDGRKVAGILVERGAGAVIGIGVNANLAVADFPDELRSTATSLQILNGTTVDRSELARDLIRSLDLFHERSRRDGAAVLCAPWRARGELIGRPVSISTPAGTEAGRLDDLDLIDGVRLRTARGLLVHIPASDVLAIAPAEADSGRAEGPVFGS
jgi:BirA family transcriptional regulator, biotin operon repressor / biotin---[acetyl-CoA-carboxylase] ligase